MKAFSMKAYCVLSAVVLVFLSVLILPLEILSILFGALAVSTLGVKAARMRRFFWLVWGNDEDPSPPRWYLAGVSMDFPTEQYRVFMWYLRNSHHNLQWHVIGVHDRQFMRTGDFPAQIWNPAGGWNFAVIRYRWLLLPFVSYRGKGLEWYVGWRESGAFGRALRKAHAQ